MTVETKTSSYDMLNGALVSSITLVGFLTTILLFIWMTWSFDYSANGSSLGLFPAAHENPEGYDQDTTEPGVDEFPEIPDPALKESLIAVTDAVSAVSGSDFAYDSDSEKFGPGQRLGTIDGLDGIGLDRVPEPLAEHRRWKIEYEPSDVQAYGEQLSFFGIDIGAVSLESNDIFRINDPAEAKRIIASDRSTETENKSLYFTHERQQLIRWDTMLVEDAGVEMAGRNTVHFYPEETRDILRKAELEYLATVEGELVDVKRTFFKIVSVEDGYEFQVSKVTFRR